MADLEVRQGEPLTLDQAQNVLSRAARNLGRVFGVTLGVGRSGEVLMFVDDLGEPVVNGYEKDGETECLAATKREIDDGMFLKLFGGRAIYAAMVLKISEIMESEKDGS